MGKNNDMPRKESFQFFERTIRAHDKVESLDRESTQVYNLYKINGDKIKIYLTNLYTIGIADYFSITQKYPDIKAIITSSNWNSYTRQAKEEAKKDGVGIFVFEEFMGALNDDRIYEYIKRDYEGKPIRFWR